MSISFNKIILVGRLTRDPEVKYSTSGTQISLFALAVDRKYKSNDGDNTDFIRIVCFGKLADFVANYLVKGRLVLVEGELRVRRWKTSEGASRTTAEVVAGSINFMETKSRSNNNVNGNIPVVDDNFDVSGDSETFGSDDVSNIEDSDDDTVPF